MSKTPRTDEQLKLEAFFDGIGIVETVEVEFAQQLETDLAEAEKKVFAYKTALELAESELIEARAEIERLKNKNTASITAHMCLSLRHAFTSGAYKGYAHGTEKRLLEQMFAEWCNKDYPEAVEKEKERYDDAERKDKLIEQMRNVLKHVRQCSCSHMQRTTHDMIDAALSAAERDRK